MNEYLEYVQNEFKPHYSQKKHDELEKLKAKLKTKRKTSVDPR
jgi:hypothetical protein